MIMKCNKCFNEMPIIHYPGVGDYIEPCKYCEENSIEKSYTDEDLEVSYNEGYADALSELKTSVLNVQTIISDIDMDISSLLADIERMEKIKENE